MRKSILFITTMFLILAGTAKAQEFNSNKNNYLVFTKNIQQLKPTLLTANELAIEDEDEYGEFHIVICGNTVSDIPNNSEFIELLKQAKKQNVSVFACGLSLNQFNVSSDQLPDDIETIDNGILYGLQVAKKGFITLTI
ncbi:MAG: sulfur reduction protein DsrE [Bacteroidales bacterium]|nr:sulfur reduction protein DsrE [Bacteroidales bacterium]